ncbi:hypothetical protein M378DRAFT_174534, partial [Amanita muscaria Koide BX008]
LDSGRCLITFEKKPNASQQAAHIVARKTSTTDLTRIEKMWQVSNLNLDSTRNLVTLRADWNLSYDHGDWAFVPAKDILRKILKYKATSFDKPYPGFDPDELHDYVFVPLPSLRRHYILRQMTEFDEDEDESEGEGEDEDDESEDEDERDNEGEDRERGGWRAESGDEQEEGEGDDEQDMVDIEDGNATIHITPFLGFPILKHHAHPFLVIYNALPRLRKQPLQLRQEHHELLDLMTRIEAIWISRLSKTLSSSKLAKRRRPSNDDDDKAQDDQPKRKTRGAAKRGNSELPGADRLKIRETRGRVNVGKVKGKAGGTTPAQPQESQYLPPSPTSETVKALHTRDFLYDDMSEVAAWAAAVATAGPPEDADAEVIWSDEEPVRKPIKNWDRWQVPYKQPKQRARFCSSDWPMYLISFPLWMPPYKK